MTVTVRFKHLPASMKSIVVDMGKRSYYCNGHRLPKFVWEMI